MRFSWSRSVSRPVDEVVSLLEDPQHPLRWQPGLERIEPVRGSLGREGAASRYIYDLDGVAFEMTETLLVNRLPELRTVRYEGRGLRHSVTLSLQEIDDGTATVLETKHAGTLTGWYRVLAPKVRASYRERWQIEFELLCDYLDGAT